VLLKPQAMADAAALSNACHACRKPLTSQLRTSFFVPLSLKMRGLFSLALLVVSGLPLRNFSFFLSVARCPAAPSSVLSSDPTAMLLHLLASIYLVFSILSTHVSALCSLLSAVSL
jgi:hypothetical protein